MKPILHNTPMEIARDASPRRKFFRTLGTLLTLPLASCASSTSGRGQGVNLGSGDVGIVNFALALEGLEAEYYTQVMNQPYAGMSREEGSILRDIRDHEITHRDYLRKVLGAQAIPPLQYDFSRINFGDRNSVLIAAMTFEDLGVAAYNGAGDNLKDASILSLAGQIVSVEARHASAIRDLLYPNTGYFAPVALDNGDKFPTVLRKADPYIVTKINGSNLPS